MDRRLWASLARRIGLCLRIPSVDDMQAESKIATTIDVFFILLVLSLVFIHAAGACQAAIEPY